MTNDRFQIALSVKEALDDAEACFPGSRPLARLHNRLHRLLENHRDELTDDQFVALGGGTDKTPLPPE